MAQVKWIKVYTDMFDSDRRIRQIEAMPEGDAILVIWLKLNLLAGNINDRGSIYLTPTIPYTEEMLANELRRPLNTVRLALKVLEGFGMLHIDDVLSISDWEEKQNVEGMELLRERNTKENAREKNRLRKQRQREVQKQLEGRSQALPSTVTPDVTPCHADVTPDVTPCHADVTPCHATDRGIDIDKELHSFTLSRARTHEEEAGDGDLGEEQEQEDLYTRREMMRGELGQGLLLLSGEQFDDLVERLSEEELYKYMGIVADCERRGMHFTNRTHYQAILDMAMKDRRVMK